MELSPYNQEQIDAITITRKYLHGCSESQIEYLRAIIEPYLIFRQETAEFQEQHLSEICTRNCFTSWTSACCGREGIMTFFADVVINILLSPEQEIDTILETLLSDAGGTRCVYLSNESGCLWHLKPIVCEMFLCDKAKETVLRGDESLKLNWDELRRREKDFTWPDKPVLFDEIEEIFINEGFDSPLMYCHKSPGLMRVKRALSSKHSAFRKKANSSQPSALSKRL